MYYFEFEVFYLYFEIMYLAPSASRRDGSRHFHGSHGHDDRGCHFHLLHLNDFSFGRLNSILIQFLQSALSLDDDAVQWRTRFDVTHDCLLLLDLYFHELNFWLINLKYFF